MAKRKRKRNRGTSTLGLGLSRKKPSTRKRQRTTQRGVRPTTLIPMGGTSTGTRKRTGKRGQVKRP